MLTLNLLEPAASAIAFERFLFPDGQPHITIKTESLPDHRESCRIITRMANANDVLLALLVHQTLSTLGFERIELVISYLTGARMDRVMTNGEPFSLKVIAGIINMAGFHKVAVFDPHSNVSTALLNRSHAIDNTRFVSDAIQNDQARFPAGNWCLVSPDAGALKKVHDVAQVIGAGHVVECLKTRDVKTGKLSGFKVFDGDLAGKTCYIADDICDGGGTFIGIAGQLRKHNAGRVVLIVSHGIFSKGFSLAGIDAIYTTDSFRTFDSVHDSLTVLPVMTYLTR
ncbi:ribose-phosphate diphosphokinase [Arsenicibacter rosenii]|uniref:Uncharacterized protein n=1 Tax=Arsenicibacter rosenii TaxID=1750698 RepID=A0A1S2VPC7_9BACT|nr:ribose-phosphate diphosphokinase [Arsenicibacter rosenii]OIN60046.1 hypothetical protein BLX24_04125 [Arsenicibacter rosenii]